MQKSKRFNKKQAVRFVLVPGRDQNGNPTTMFKPVQTKNRLSKAQKNKIISQISDYQIEIDGKPVDESDLPAYVLEQIKGRADLVFNQKNPDMFDIGDNDEEDIMEQMMQDGEEWDDEQGELIPQEQYMGEDYIANKNNKEQQIAEKKQKTSQPKQQNQPKQIKQIQVDGQKYKLTQQQIKMLDQVLPQNYQNYNIEGVQFIKYDQDGNRIDQRQKYKQFIAQPLQRRAIIDSFDYVPEKPVDVVDDDLQGENLRGDMKELDDALNFEGQEDAYEQLQDDFFAKLIGDGQNDQKKKKQIKQNTNGQGFKKNKNQTQQGKPLIKQQPKTTSKNDKKPTTTTTTATAKKQQPKSSNLDDIDGDDDAYEDDQDYQDDDEQYEDQQDYEQQITDEMLDKAIQQFDNRQKIQKPTNIQQEQDQQIKRIAGTGIPVTMKGMDLIKFIQQRQGCTGKDGQLDWRTLTKKQKRQYMKNKKIRQAFDQIRQREIAQKLKDKQNVNAQELHLKQYIKHIPYNEDHVMQQAIQRDQQQVVDIYADANQEDFQTDSDQDDIISYRAKTSIISSNLATVDDGPNKKKNKKNDVLNGEESKQEDVKNIERIKVVPEKRNKKQTPEERKQRKDKLKQMKKLKKQQKKEFSQMFEDQRKKVVKKVNSNHNNPLHKVPYIKIV